MRSNIQLCQGDCLELLKSIPDKSVDLVITDPPYDVHAVRGGGTFGNRQAYSDIEFMSNGFSENILNELCRVMKKTNIYLFCSQKQIIPLIDYFVKGKRCNWNLLAWHKTNPVPACSNKYLTDTEFILFFRDKGVKVLGEFKTKFTYYVTPLNQSEKRKYGHPTVKPEAIIRNLIVNSSIENDIVLDPFMGTGTTGAACINTNRRFVGMELDKKYFEIAKNRISDAVLPLFLNEENKNE